MSIMSDGVMWLTSDLDSDFPTLMDHIPPWVGQWKASFVGVSPNDGGSQMVIKMNSKLLITEIHLRGITH